MFTMLSFDLDASELVGAVSVSEQMSQSHDFDERVPGQDVKKAEHSQICVGKESGPCSSDIIIHGWRVRQSPSLEAMGPVPLLSNDLPSTAAQSGEDFVVSEA